MSYELKKGLIYSFFGYGSGKTKSAFGMCLRAIANNEKILVVQFLKSPTSFDTGEVRLCREHFPSMRIEQFGFDKITLASNVNETDKNECQKAWDFLLSEIKKESYSLIVLDEVLPSLDMKLITQKQLFEFLDNRTINIDVVLTGRINSKSLRNNIIEVSDIATDMYARKHVWNRLCPRCNVEYKYSDNFCSLCGKELNLSKKAKKGREF